MGFREFLYAVNRRRRALMRGLGVEPGFEGSAEFWEKRYAGDGHSGEGSSEELARFKARVVNDFVRKHGVRSVVEFGCGDGRQLALYRVPRYTGLEVSRTALDMCRKRFRGDSTKTFALYGTKSFRADLAMSIDVIYHLVEDDVFEKHMRDLFASAERFVMIYSTDTDENAAVRPPHILRRKFSDWVAENAPEWKLLRRVRNVMKGKASAEPENYADFFIYARE